MSDNYATFLRPHAERSAAPHPDREPEKRGMPPAPEPPPPPKPTRLDAFPPEAVETYRKVTQLAIDVQGIPPCLIGHMPGELAKLNVADWHWRPPPRSGPRLVMEAQQDTPIHCEGASFANARDAKRVRLHITEAEAQRINLGEALRGIDASASGLSPARLAREKMRRR